MAEASGALVWFRRDLRDADHAALHAALSAHRTDDAFYFFTSSLPSTTRIALAQARADARGSDGAAISVWRRVPGVPASVPEVGELSPVVVREEAA